MPTESRSEIGLTGYSWGIWNPVLFSLEYMKLLVISLEPVDVSHVTQWCLWIRDVTPEGNGTQSHFLYNYPTKLHN